MHDTLLRVQRLEDIEAIRQLKARYFHACDRKDVSTLRRCFAEGTVNIDYGAIGRFTDREAFLEVYQTLACHPHIIDMHHGQNAQIDWVSPNEARATWDLYFYQINRLTQTLTQLGGYYRDRFVKGAHGWQIVETVFTPTSTLVSELQEGNVRVVVAG